MGLCGSYKCGCGISVTDGLTLSGSGEAGSPWVVGNGGLPRIGGRWSRAAAQAIPNATITRVTWDTEVFDYGIGATVTTSFFTIPSDGIWVIASRLSYSGTSLGSTNFIRLIMGSDARDFVGPSTVSGTQAGVYAMDLTAGAPVAVDAYQASGASLNVTGSIGIYRIGN
jgi:hypothetical protein